MAVLHVPDSGVTRDRGRRAFGMMQQPNGMILRRLVLKRLSNAERFTIHSINPFVEGSVLEDRL